jgi:hypothetical protein
MRLEHYLHYFEQWVAISRGHVWCPFLHGFRRPLRVLIFGWGGSKRLFLISLFRERRL